MRPRVKPALRRIIRDEHTLQLGVHPRRAVMLTDLTRPIRQWIGRLDGTLDLGQALREAAAAGLDEPAARSLLDQLTSQGIVHDAALPTPLTDVPLSERDRLRPDLDALDLASTTLDGGHAALARRRQARVRVYGAGRVGAQIVTLLAACGVGHIRVIDAALTRPSDVTPGGLTWSEVGLPREEAAVAVARRLTSGAPHSPEHASMDPNGTPRSASRSAPSIPRATPPGSRATAPGSRATPLGSKAIPHGSKLSPPSSLAAPSGLDASSLGRGAVARRRRPSATEDASSPRPPAEVSAPGPVGGAAPSVDVRAGAPYLGDGSQRPDLVILAPVTPLDGVLVSELTDLGIPHLLASAYEGHGSVGPLVLPGETACLHCLDLSRRDHDPGWPIVTARLGGFPPGEIACDSALATAVAAAATGHALAHLEGRESIVTNGTVDVMPDWRWKTRTWAKHQQCRCMRNNPYSLRMVMSASQ
ncbi:ThiF family adenylyltransferase [Nonomuraea sp. NPDC000554]|uniref:ThiF family adenylyltransferase n=1 Tax=Nonomuraea sp. NPDC000554 TaxID=3154259 RepID=UPI003327BDDD